MFKHACSDYNVLGFAYLSDDIHSLLKGQVKSDYNKMEQIKLCNDIY